MKDRLIEAELQRRKYNLVVFGFGGVEKGCEVSMRKFMKEG